MKRKYIDQQLGPVKLQIIEKVNQILTEYEKANYNLTVRQIYYQFVSRGWLQNNDANYKKLQSVINEGRLCGLIDWNRIVDVTRDLRGPATWAGPRTRMKSVVSTYATDKWHNQPIRPEVWIEKDALLDIVSRPCNRLQVNYISCRGYMSQSEMWAAAQRIGKILRSGQSLHLLHLGDHDPSGINMSHDIISRLNMFISNDDNKYLAGLHQTLIADIIDETGFSDFREVKAHRPDLHQKLLEAMNETTKDWGKFTFERLGLNMSQIVEKNPPPNPTKLSDRRASKYIDIYGEHSYELDALRPSYIESLITDAINKIRDLKLWNFSLQREHKERKMLKMISENFNEVQLFLNQKPSVPVKMTGERGRRVRIPRSAQPPGSSTS